MSDLSAPRERVRTRLVRLAGATLTLGVAGVALWFLHRELAGLSRTEVLGHIGSLAPSALLGALALTIGSYATLTGYDVVALRYLDRQLPYRRIALTSFMAYAVGNNVGLAALSGGSIRYRLYTLAGLSGSEIARLIAFVSTTFVLGTCVLLGLALLLMPDAQSAILHLPPAVSTVLALLLLAFPAGYLALSLLRRAPLPLGAWTIAVPRPGTAVAQILVSVVDLSFAAGTLYVLLAPSMEMGYFAFLGRYLLAIAAGLISSVPGGIGVFEAVLLASLPDVAPSALLGTVLVYRLIYYVLPLSAALLLLVGHESRLHGAVIRQSLLRAGGWLGAIAPQLVGTMVFLAGVVLMVSGASPAVTSRLHLIERGIPLPVLELSHLIGSVLGALLLLLAAGLFRRLRTAWTSALVALLGGALVSLLKGVDYEEALLLTGIAFGVWLARGEFYREGRMVEQRFSAHWILAIALVFAVVVWVTLISYRHVEYTDRLWWQFAFDAQAPRAMRAGALAAMVAFAFGVWKVRRGLAPEGRMDAGPEQIEAVRHVLAGASSSSANIALLGDKRFLWSRDRAAFIMYGVSGDSWIALGDPVGPADHHEDLLWRFRELVDVHAGRTVFYQVSQAALSLYVDLGLTLAKLGEEARVPLEGFSLQGSQRAELRQADNRARRSGAVFEVVPREAVSGILGDLRRVSDAWLSDKATAEKSFSLGSFSEAYVSQFDCAVVRVDGAIVAFANLWKAPAVAELSVDLMRYDDKAPKGIMDHLFVQLMLWGASNGYRWFNLGMAPLSGMEDRPLAPLWHKLGNLVFDHGEPFYNFEGLRHYKDKFHPQWEPLYLACPGGWWNLPLALLDASRLISGGMAGIVRR